MVIQDWPTGNHLQYGQIHASQSSSSLPSSTYTVFGKCSMTISWTWIWTDLASIFSSVDPLQRIDAFFIMIRAASPLPPRNSAMPNPLSKRCL